MAMAFALVSEALMGAVFAAGAGRPGEALDSAPREAPREAIAAGMQGCFRLGALMALTALLLAAVPLTPSLRARRSS